MDSTYEQLVDRNAELEADKARLAEQLEQAEAEIVEMRKQLAMARCA